MPYRTFRELALHERRGNDYTVQSRRGRTGLLVMAPHGGGIEPGTDILAASLAGRRHAFYGFIGLKCHGNRLLHLTSHRFDEPVARRMTRQALWVLTLHGCAANDATIRVGGRDREGRLIFQKCLQKAGVRTRLSGRTNLAGRHPANLCNRGRLSRGVQLEIARDLRNPRLQSDGGHALSRHLVKALTAALASIPAAGPINGKGRPDRIQKGGKYSPAKPMIRFTPGEKVQLPSENRLYFPSGRPDRCGHGLPLWHRAGSNAF